MKKNSTGFTLLEVLMVTALIGIFAALALSAYRGHGAKAKATAVIHNAEAAGADAAVMKAVYGVVGVPTQYTTVSVEGKGAITARIGQVSGGASEAAGTRGVQASLRVDTGNLQYVYKAVFE
jgi:prepilin-type N-terminal cleavage/methylation domain-containing protein